MINPLVSVLIPTYDRPHFLREAVASVLAQESGDFELIVGDELGRGEEVCAAFADPRVRYIRNPVRLGMANNWNALVAASTAPMFGFLMDDDRWAPAFLTATVAALEAHERAGFAFTNHLYDHDSVMTTRGRLMRPGWHPSPLLDLLRDKPASISGALFRRAATATTIPLPDTAAADMVLFARVADAGWGCVYVDEPLMTYRAHEAMFSGSSAFRDDVVRAWEGLSFAHPEAEGLRRRHLADALTARGADHLKHRRTAPARADLRAARALARPGPRALALTALSTAPVLLPLAERVRRQPLRRPTK